MKIQNDYITENFDWNTLHEQHANILYNTYTHTKQTHTHALVFEISLRRIIKNKKKTWKTYDYFKNLKNNKKKLFLDTKRQL